ncbi:hypothetical protein AB0873_28980 [Micromonospora sp. NPDC047707]|uniref:hypothetical protein n=1 Tax=Micromonospora sp. NPDC047707 TaxID=3154498 RepID=UPI0034549C74
MAVCWVGKATTFIPVEAISRVTDAEVHVSVSRQKVSQAPVYDPDVVGDQSYYETLYGCYGYLPFWNPTYPVVPPRPTP